MEQEAETKVCSLWDENLRISPGLRLSGTTNGLTVVHVSSN